MSSTKKQLPTGIIKAGEAIAKQLEGMDL